MRLLFLPAIALIALGIAILLGKIEIDQRKDVIKIGEFKASVQSKQPVAPWIGGIAIGLGAGLAVFALTRRR
ncbi:MAG: hypothetical protein IPF83_09760 [Rhodanobacteraceae bacterium]|nr:hypothetical protein [Rhodanobacteraceae bacterium]MBP9155481.1 hypothetical protein [Xanthomonadales bacterium]HQW80916.1 hypothetical protein [Pseudomonadota bacterium]